MHQSARETAQADCRENDHALDIPKAQAEPKLSAYVDSRIRLTSSALSSKLQAQRLPDEKPAGAADMTKFSQLNLRC